jgi:hypothetical protein
LLFTQLEALNDLSEAAVRGGLATERRLTAIEQATLAANTVIQYLLSKPAESWSKDETQRKIKELEKIVRNIQGEVDKRESVFQGIEETAKRLQEQQNKTDEKKVKDAFYIQ